ncbi:hypothetical protein Taro_003777 [Colocasia esculenta]|uniref:Calcineurin-like phosphoesterase domain-containing protein n=1 Tax=Colocasia esculenta TaxID=4460 RepID=A0A843TSZ4_COLES|nr:hypothetical protein [Colocasia esculenta]
MVLKFSDVVDCVCRACNGELHIVDLGFYQKPIKGCIKLMLSNLASSYRVLLTHIPLYRPDGTACGPYRSSPIINQRVSRSGSDKGIRYQNYLTEETSKQLLELIKPMLVLSGHDHDQCTVTHSTSFGPVTEVSL